MDDWAHALDTIILQQGMVAVVDHCVDYAKFQASRSRLDPVVTEWWAGVAERLHIAHIDLAL